MRCWRSIAGPWPSWTRSSTDVRAAYEAYDFHGVYQTLHQFCTVTLSARYFDIIKDRLYTFAPKNQARRSAQTALYQIADALARMLAPILVFTADEIWENLPANSERSRRCRQFTSVCFPAAERDRQTG